MTVRRKLAGLAVTVAVLASACGDDKPSPAETACMTEWERPADQYACLQLLWDSGTTQARCRYSRC